MRKKKISKKRKKVLRKKKILRKKKRKVSKKEIFPQEKIEALIKKGKERGFVTFSEILYFFPQAEKDLEGLESLYEVLEKDGIEVKEAKEFLEVEKITGKPKKAPPLGTLDPVQMYLKEIGQYSFITPQEEKDLSKRIEKGDVEAKRN